MSNDTSQVSIVKFGTRSTVKSDVYLNFHIYQTADEPVDMDYFFWVIRNGQRTVVVDTGFSRHGGEVRNRTFLIEPAAAFAALGVDPGERAAGGGHPRALRPHRQPRPVPGLGHHHGPR